ncbi:uncharacterized protein LOC131212255 [Anopheles bellator]|uniref:uncharacterized protein LOC131212255 n=1 Tax=Anopheles bellator TaxID=139047 RepID=UPI002648975B|nr:uncharacterized protein LOC131212255 [Anopheles bellator]
MPRMKKKVDDSVSGPSPAQLPVETLTAGRSRRTIKPNPRYQNDEMVMMSTRSMDAYEGSEVSGEEYDQEEDEELRRELMARRAMLRSATPQSEGVPKRRGRPPKNKNLLALRTEPMKNLRKEVLKKMDMRTLSMGQSRLLGSSLVRDGRRRLDMSTDPMDTDSADQDDLGMEELEQRGSDDGNSLNAYRKVLNPGAYKMHMAEKTVLVRRGSGMRGTETRTADGTSEEEEEEEEEEDEDDYFNDSDSRTERQQQPLPPKRGRPRKHPLAKKPASPFVAKVLLPGMKHKLGGGTVLKRKSAPATDSDDEGRQQDSQQRTRMLRRSYGVKGNKNDPNESESDNEENDKEQQRRALQRTRSFPSLMRPGQSRVTQKTEQQGEKQSLSPTITIVNVNDIMKKKSKSSTDLRRRMEAADVEEPAEDEGEEQDSDGTNAGDKPKTNNRLVATILERKRPIVLEQPRDMRRKTEMFTKALAGRAKLGEDVDYDEVLEKNILSPVHKVGSRVAQSSRGRGRGTPSARAKENLSGGYKTNNNLYKGGTNGRYSLGDGRLSAGRGLALKRPNQPPRILNATMKMGEGKAQSKLAASGANNHYSIDLTDPDNNVTLISSNDSTPTKRILPSTALRPGGLVLGRSNATSTPLAAGRPLASQVQRPAVIGRTVDMKKKKITCYETWYVISCKNQGNLVKKPTFALTMIGLGNIASSIQLPSDAWSLRTVLERRKTPAGEGQEIFCGEVQDNTIAEADKFRFEPNRIMFRRKAPIPGRFNVQYDRTVIFRNDTYMINVEGQSCRLVGAPVLLETLEDIETLLTIVDFIDVENSCVEVAQTGRSFDATVFPKRIVVNSSNRGIAT